jgi:hypothetical protein
MDRKYNSFFYFFFSYFVSPRQVRSFASNMHNDGTFQYFALDFGNSKAALHGSVLLAQADFVNQALQYISKLYSQHVGLFIFRISSQIL